MDDFLLLVIRGSDVDIVLNLKPQISNPKSRISKHSGGEAYLPETVVLKLNGGLGTSMGLDKAKSLLPVKGDDSFLDLTAKQVIVL